MTLRLTKKRLATVFLPTTEGAVYTAPVDQTASVEEARLCNNSPTDETYSFWAPEGTSPTDANALRKTITISAGADIEVSCLRGLTVEPGWTIIAKCSTASVLTLVIDGLLIADDGT